MGGGERWTTFLSRAVAQCEVRRSLSTRLRGGGGGGEESGELFSVLQSGASAPGVGLSEDGREVLWKKRMRLRRAKRGDVIGRPAWESSFLGHPDANFFRRKPGWLENSATRRIPRTESIFPTPVSPRVAATPSRLQMQSGKIRGQVIKLKAAIHLRRAEFQSEEWGAPHSIWQQREEDESKAEAR